MENKNMLIFKNVYTHYKLQSISASTILAERYIILKRCFLSIDEIDALCKFCNKE
jgi:hypothetical protein